MAGAIFRARSEFAVVIDGAPLLVHRGDLVREGHALLHGRSELFEPYEPDVRFEVRPKAKPRAA